MPIRDYEGLLPWLLRARRGEHRVLSSAPVTFFERSGGTTSEATKLIPYTQPMLDELAAATSPWLAGLYGRHPGLVGRVAYWSLSPAAQGERVTEGGLPIGIDDDTAYFGPLRRYVLGRSMAVPSAVTRERSVTSWRRETLAHLLSHRDLGLVSVWSPTFLTALLEGLVGDADGVLGHPRLKRSIRRRREVERALASADAGREGLGAKLWPGLGVISCWADGPSRRAARELGRLFPGTFIEAKGLLATEGVVSIPWGPDRAPTLALASHFYEFLEVDDAGRLSAEPVLADELVTGRRYSPVLTTGAGLYRYHLRDIVRCEGPLVVRFEAKLDVVGDLVGEKLDGERVTREVEAAALELSLGLGFWLLTPTAEVPRRYGLIVDVTGRGDAAPSEARLAALAEAVERRLCEGHAYRYARELGQLEPVRVWRLEDAERRWLEAAVVQGQRLGDVKPTRFDPRPRWGSLFAAARRIC